VYGHFVRCTARLLHDFDGSLQDYEEGKPAVPFLEQHVARRNRSHPPPATKGVYVGPTEPGEGDIMFGWHLQFIANVSRPHRDDES
jgi:hypothetical protein